MKPHTYSFTSLSVYTIVMAAMLASTHVATLAAAPSSSETAPILEILHTFSKDGNNPAREPLAGLVLASDGNFYGSTSEGGGFTNGRTGRGTIFRMSPDGTVTTVHTFGDSSGGWTPSGDLWLGADKLFYGVTTFGTGSSLQHYGTAFSYSPISGLRHIATFVGYGALHPKHGLVQGDDGKWYGVTSVATAETGASERAGAIYTLTAGTDSVLYLFPEATPSAPAPDGAHPTGRLAKGRDGNFYGVTSDKGTNGYGTVFKVTPSGQLTTLVAFNGVNGRKPKVGLTRGSEKFDYEEI